MPTKRFYNTDLSKMQWKNVIFSNGRSLSDCVSALDGTEGGVIFLEPGTYTDTSLSRNGVSVIGCGQPEFTNAFTLSGNDCLIDGCKFSGSGTTLTISGDRNVISRCYSYVSDSSSNAIGCDVSGSNNTIKESHFDRRTDSSSSDVIGVKFQGSTNRFVNSRATAINITANMYVAIGIHLAGSGDHKVGSGSLAVGWTSHARNARGIDISSSRNQVVGNSVITYNIGSSYASTSGCIYIQGDNNAISGNSIYQNSTSYYAYGLNFISGGDNNVASCNTYDTFRSGYEYTDNGSNNKIGKRDW